MYFFNFLLKNARWYFTSPPVIEGLGSIMQKSAHWNSSKNLPNDVRANQCQLTFKVCKCFNKTTEGVFIHFVVVFSQRKSKCGKKIIFNAENNWLWTNRTILSHMAVLQWQSGRLKTLLLHCAFKDDWRLTAVCVATVFWILQRH